MKNFNVSFSVGKKASTRGFSFPGGNFTVQAKSKTDALHRATSLSSEFYADCFDSGITRYKMRGFDVFAFINIVN